METITLTVDKSLLEDAKRVAEATHTTLDAVFSGALRRLTSGAQNSIEYRDLMTNLRHVDSGGTFSREEMNDRY